MKETEPPRDLQIGKRSVPIELLEDYVDSLKILGLIPDGPIHDWHLDRISAIENILGGDNDE